MKGKFAKFGMTLTAIAVIAWCGGQVLAQGGGSGSEAGGSTSGSSGSSASSETSGSTGTSGTSAATGAGNESSGNVSSGGTQSPKSGAQSGATTTPGNQTGATGPASTGVAQSSSPQGANNLLLESQRNRTQSPTGTATGGTATQPGQPSQSATNIAAGAGTQERSILSGASGQMSPAVEQRDALSTIHFAPATGRGLTIETLGPGSIFFDSGLRPGDVILAINNQPLASDVDFERAVAAMWGQRIPATVLRDGREETIFITFPQQMTGQLSQDQNRLGQAQGRGYQANRPTSPSGGRAFLGVGFDTLRYNTATVRDVLPGSAAEQAGLRQGDIIVSLNGQPITSYQEAIRMIGSMQAGESLEIEFTRRMPNRAQAVLGVRPGAQPAVTSQLPSDEARFYRGEQPQPRPQVQQPMPEPQVPQEPVDTPPQDQGQGGPAPSLPSNANTGVETGNPLP